MAHGFLRREEICAFFFAKTMFSSRKRKMDGKEAKQFIPVWLLFVFSCILYALYRMHKLKIERLDIK
jgi:hypothetical protein